MATLKCASREPCASLAFSEPFAGPVISVLNLQKQTCFSCLYKLCAQLMSSTSLVCQFSLPHSPSMGLAILQVPLGAL